MIKAGLPEGEIPSEWVEVVMAAMFKWIHSTRDGSEAVLTNLLGFNKKIGDSDREYYVNTETIKSDDVVFYSGVTVAGMPCHISSLSSTKVDTNQCDECGVHTHCLTQVRNPVTDRVKDLCNYCKSLNENLTVRGNATIDDCFSCTLTSCSNHPQKSYGT